MFGGGWLRVTTRVSPHCVWLLCSACDGNAGSFGECVQDCAVLLLICLEFQGATDPMIVPSDGDGILLEGCTHNWESHGPDEEGYDQARHDSMVLILFPSDGFDR